MYVYKLYVQVPEEVRKELCFVAKVDLTIYPESTGITKYITTVAFMRHWGTKPGFYACTASTLPTKLHAWPSLGF